MKPKNLRGITYAKTCAELAHLIPKGVRLLKQGEKIPVGAKFVDEDGTIMDNMYGGKVFQFSLPHFIEPESESVQDKILNAFTGRIDELKRDAKRYANAGEYEIAGKIATRINALDEALGIAMRVVRS